MIIKRKELMEFLKNSRSIKTNKIIPVLEYIRFSTTGNEVRLSKTNMSIYLLHDMECESDKDQVFLISESQLSAVCAGSSDEDVVITATPQGTLIRSGNVELSSDMEDSVNYPEFPRADMNCITLLSKDVITYIGEARNFLREEADGPFSYCFTIPNTKGALIVATDAAIFYSRQITDNLPSIAISKEACDIISRFSELQHYRCENYDFFTSGRITYGFIGTTYKPFPYQVIIDRLSSTESLTIEKEELSRFCKMASAMDTENLPFSIMSNSKDGITVSYTDRGKTVDLVVEIPATKKTYKPEQFSFNAKLLSNALKGIPFEKIMISPVSDKKGVALAIKSDEGDGFLGMIQGFSN